ncbi:MAG: inositol monophosphatase family protein [Coriobacteriia bacterium]|nr:inositol monophosphatase family protein [Coriobacteriia bacterium]
MQKLLDTAIAAAREGGAIVEARVADMGEIRSKSASSDLVTDTDVSSGVAVCRAIAERVEGARFVCEEEEVYDLAGVARGGLYDDEVWVIDPVDGTTSFVHSYPCYSVSVACLRGGQPVAGAVYNAALREMNAAAVGLGATREGIPLHVSDAETVDTALLITGFPYDRALPMDRAIAVLGAFLRNPVHGIRRDGSAAIDCSHVAGARADGFWEFHLKPWDVAAGIAIAREAGALATDHDGTPWTPSADGICLANPKLHAGMLEVIQIGLASL